MGLFLNAMLDPFVTGRADGIGAGLGYAPEPPRSRVRQAAETAFAAALPVKAPPLAPAFEQRWSVWGAAYGGRNRTDGEPIVVGSNDLTATAAGFAAGADYRVSPDTVLGAATAIGETHWSVAGLGTGRAEAAQLGGYASTRWQLALSLRRDRRRLVPRLDRAHRHHRRRRPAGSGLRCQEPRRTARGRPPLRHGAASG